MVSVVETGAVMVSVVRTGSVVVGTGVVMVSVVVSGLGLVEVFGFAFGFADRCRLDLVMLLVKVI